MAFSCHAVKGSATGNRRRQELAKALNRAVEADHSKCVRRLIIAGADVNLTDECGRQPLIVAATLENNSCVEILIQAGANINAIESLGRAALHVTAREGKEKCLQALIRGGADINVVDREGMTPLSEALWSGKTKCVTDLIKAGANINTFDKYGVTPLMHALIPAKNPSMSIKYIKALFRASARVNIIPPPSFEAFSRTGRNALEQWLTWTLLPCPNERNKEIPMLLFAGGEHPLNTPSLWIPDYIQELMNPKEMTLKELCFKAIRSQLSNVSKVNFFVRVDKLGLPLRLQRDLLYDMSIDEEDD